jgi:hypothetical protein
VPPALEHIAYDAALRALDKQEAVVAELRARSGVLLGAASVAASFLVNAGRGSAVLAVIPYIVTVAASVFVLLPKTGLRFAVSGLGIIERLDAWREDPAEVYRRLAYELERLSLENRVAITLLMRAQRLGSLALVAEILTIGLGSTGTIGWPWP